MIKFIVDENPLVNGSYQMHNATLGCVDMPKLDNQILIGYFADFELAHKRARMNWSKEKIEACKKCCVF
ncbi:hypothetical protein [Acinetobacter defluvii]|uniref:hypothetical protein n=1 Tax=Acinetobacter defluvii TaxID=1871111 RepID=UPI003AF58FE9